MLINRFINHSRSHVFAQTKALLDSSAHSGSGGPRTEYCPDTKSNPWGQHHFRVI